MRVLQEQKKLKEAQEKAERARQDKEEEVARLRKLQEDSELALQNLNLNKKAVIGGGRTAFTDRDNDLRQSENFGGYQRMASNQLPSASSHQFKMVSYVEYGDKKQKSKYEAGTAHTSRINLGMTNENSYHKDIEGSR